MRRITVLLSLSLLQLSLLQSCAGPPVDLVIELYTDWRPETDFDEILLTVTGGASVERRRAPDPDLDHTEGVRIAEVGVSPGVTSNVAVSLLRGGVEIAAAQVIVVTPFESQVVLALVTRICARVVCPRPSDPSLTVCSNGECVDPRCVVPGEPICAESRCSSDADCVQPHACASSRCSRGICFTDFIDERCTSGRCTADGCVGCDVRETVCDDGIDADCDGRTDCEDSDCDASGCDDGLFCNGTDFCIAGVCTPSPVAACPAFCDEAMGRCLECVADGDCGPVTRDGWGGCAYADTCDESASRSRTVRSPACVEGACVVGTSTETEGCSRDRSGVGCGGTHRCFGSGCYPRLNTRNNGDVSCGTFCAWDGGSCRGAVAWDGSGTVYGCDVMDIAGVLDVDLWCHCQY